MARLSRKQLLAKNCLEIGLRYWFRNKLNVYWVTLTSSPASVDASKDIWKSYASLRRNLMIHYEVELETCTVETSEGFGVLHAFIVADGKGMPNAHQYISESWQKIHLASVVWIQTLVNRKVLDAQKLAQYTITQYTVDQGDRFVTVRWSRKTFMPLRPSDLIKKCYSYLKYEIFSFEPWHLKSRLVLGLPNIHYYAHIKMAQALMSGHTYKIKSRELFLDNMLDIVEL